MGNCTTCNKPSEYQDGPYLCYECRLMHEVFSPDSGESAMQATAKLAVCKVLRCKNCKQEKSKWHNDLGLCFYNRNQTRWEPELVEVEDTIPF